jgi:hypothetical protein
MVRRLVVGKPVPPGCTDSPVPSAVHGPYPARAPGPMRGFQSGELGVARASSASQTGTGS